MTTLNFQDRRSLAEGVAAGLCEPLPTFPAQPLCLTLPGGAQICPAPTSAQLVLFEYAMLALNMANTALAPLAPFFRVLDVIIAIHKCLTAIPEILGPPPNPKKLLDAIDELVDKLKALLRMIPQLSVPILIVEVIDIVVAVLEGFARELNALATKLKQIEAAKLASANAVGLIPLIACARAAVDVQLANLSYCMASINPLIQMLNLLAAIAGLGDPFPIPTFDDTFTDAPGVIADKILEFTRTLRSVRDALPV